MNQQQLDQAIAALTANRHVAIISSSKFSSGVEYARETLNKFLEKHKYIITEVTRLSPQLICTMICEKHDEVLSFDSDTLPPSDVGYPTNIRDGDSFITKTIQFSDIFKYYRVIVSFHNEREFKKWEFLNFVKVAL
jgi:hypothetical protein